MHSIPESWQHSDFSIVRVADFSRAERISAFPLRKLRIPKSAILGDDRQELGKEESMRRNIESMITTPTLIYSGFWLVVVLAVHAWMK
jgi:hypothetical protein